MELKLSVNNLSFAYDKEPVLEDISFELEGGDVCLLLGKNASGKSTLLKCINRIFVSNSGEIVVNGKSISTEEGLETKLRDGDEDFIDKILFCYPPSQTPASLEAPGVNDELLH